MTDRPRGGGTGPIGVMVVDDHPVFRKGLAGLLREESDLTVYAEADDVPSARRLIEEGEPDVILVDLSLDGSSGLDLVKDIRRQGRSTPILVVSMYEERLYAERALQAGADGYLTKAEAADRVVQGIRTILAGNIYLTGDWADRILQRRLRAGMDADAPEETLSDREMEVFDLIGQGCSSREIAQRLKRSPKTIDSHREHIKNKLGGIDNAALVQRAVRWHLHTSGGA